MSDAHEAKQATPHATLLAELLDPRIPKSEREHAAAREIERLRAERDNARARFELAAKLLTDIHALLYLPPTTLPDGRTFVFRRENPGPHEVLQELSDRIRALPDEIAAIDEVKEHR